MTDAGTRLSDVATILVRAEELYKTVLSDPVAAEAESHRLLSESRKSGNAEALVVALRTRAWALRQKPDLGTALTFLEEASAVATRHRLNHRQVEVLLSSTAVLSEMGRSVAAQRALRRAAALDVSHLQAELHLTHATLLCNMGRADEAAVLLARVINDPLATGDQRAKSHNNLAILHSYVGRGDSAMHHINRALSEAAASGPLMEAVATQTAAWVYVQAGKLTEGLQLFTSAGALYERAGLSLGEHHSEYADALADLRLIPEALRAAQQAVDALASTPLMRAEAELRTARLLLLAGRPDDAHAAAETAVQELRRQGRPGWVSRAVCLSYEAKAATVVLTPAQGRALRDAATRMCEHGLTMETVEAFLVLGRNPGSRQRDDLLMAHRLARRGSVLTRLRGRLAAALAAQLDGDTAEVLRHCRSGLDDLASHRSSLGSMELRALASGHGVELGDLGLRTLLPSGRPMQVLAWMERTRAAAVISGEPAIAAEAVQSASTNDRPPSTPIAEEHARRTSWLAAPTTASIPRFDVRRLRPLLKGKVLVEYAVLDNAVHAVVLDETTARLIPIGALQPIVHDGDALLFALRRLSIAGAAATSVAAARRSVEALTRRLTQRLLSPLDLRPDASLVIVPVGGLQRLPWAPLHAGQVAIAPSATIWASTVGEQKPASAVALVAGPELPGAVDEVRALSASYGNASVLLPPSSTVEATLAMMQTSDLTHLACHGLIRADNAMFSSLTLSDGPLTMHELSSRIRGPRQVVLAACDSAVQTAYAGGEALGFVSALLASGTKGLLASTVLLPDLDTTPLMSAVHAELRRGSSMSAALHKARQMLDIEEPGAFVAWCAFQAYGAG